MDFPDCTRPWNISTVETGSIEGKVEPTTYVSSGGYGKVKMCGTSQVVKLSKHNYPEDGMNASFLREVVMMKMINHPHVMPLEYAIFENGEAKIVMKKMDGDLLEKSPVSFEGRMNAFFAIVCGLAELARHGLFHGDLKPENVLRETIRGNSHWRVADLACIPLLFDVKSQMYATSYPYRAPEIAKGSLDEKIDMWSLGCILYQMFREKHLLDVHTKEAYIRESQKEIVRDSLPPSVEPILVRLIERDPQKRISIWELIDFLKESFPEFHNYTIPYRDVEGAGTPETIQTNIQKKNRRIVSGWMDEIGELVVQNKRFSKMSFLLFERFLGSIGNVSTSNLQPVACACMLIISKILNLRKSLTPKNLNYYSDDSADVETIIFLERFIVETLDFNVL